MASYGPPPPPGGTPPGGFSCIITSQTIGPSGGTIGPLGDGALTVTITIPPNTFPEAVTVTISEPFGSGQCQGYPLRGMRGYSLIGGVGIEVSVGNTAFTHFRHPLLLQIGRVNVAGFQFEEVGVVTAGGFVSDVTGRRHEGPITIAVRNSEVLAVFVRTLRRHFPFGHTTAGNSVVASPAELVTASLRPPGSWLPGLGVLLVADSGSLLSVSRAEARVSR